METEIIVAIIGSGALSTVVAQVLAYLNQRRERKSGQSAAIRLVLKDRLRYLCGHYINQGWIYEDELEDIIRMHRCYHDTLSGNGYLDELMKRVKALDIRGMGK